MEELSPVWEDAPRHVPSREFPRYRFLGDLHPHPRTHPEGSLYGAPDYPPGLPADRWREDESYLFGVDLYHQGFLWEAHEAWEACYFATDDGEQRELLQALIQLAAALIQAHRGRGGGVRRLARRVDGRLARITAPRLLGLDVPDLRAQLRAHFSAAIENGPVERAHEVHGLPPRLRLHSS